MTFTCKTAEKIKIQTKWNTKKKHIKSAACLNGLNLTNKIIILFNDLVSEHKNYFIRSNTR